MIKMIYTVDADKKAGELEWLREQKIFPAVEEDWDWRTSKKIAHFGVIVSPEAALTLKLRHKLDLQDDYRQR
jgi:hypothetical protein